MARPEPVTVVLSEPIKVWDETCNALVATHKLTAGDFELLDNLEKTPLLLKTISLIYRTEGGKQPEVRHLRALDGDDLDALEEAAVPFVRTSREIETNASDTSP